MPDMEPNPPLSVLTAKDPYAVIEQRLLEEAQARRAGVQSQMDMIEKQAAQYGQKGMSDIDKASMLFQAAGALAAPTRSGGLMESIGAAGTAVAGPLSKAAQAERDRQDKVLQLQMARAKLATEMGAGGVSASDMLALAKARADSQPKPGEAERLMERLRTEKDPQVIEAIRSKLGMAEKTGETERLMERLRTEKDPQIIEAIRSKLGVTEDQGKPVTLTLSDGSTTTALFKDGKFYDPITGKLFSEERAVTTRQEAAANDRKDQAVELGVPVETRDPYSNLNPKDREKARTARYNADTRALQKQFDDAPDTLLRNEIADYKRFVMLNNENQSTGPFWGKTPNLTASAQQMKEIESKLKISAGKDLKGAASDKDVAMFGETAPSTSKDLKANYNIARFGVMRAQTELERREFMRNYLEVNKNLANADRLWQEYLNANPFFKYPDKNFDPAKMKVDDLVPNDKRMTYQEYFRKGMRSAPTAVRRNERGELVAD